MNTAMMYQRMVVKHNTIANRTLTHDANTIIECVPFSNLGKIQPFLISLYTNAALLMDFHCHLTKSEVSGYLAGHWDVNAHNLQVTHAFPCRNTKADRENGPNVEQEIAKTIEKEKLTLVGWYHSHPFAPAAPTLRDVDAQLDYQIKMKGTSDNNYSPCIGIILSPYNYDNTSLESSIIAYWVIPPPETKPNEYGRPMLMSYSVVQDSLVQQQVKDEIKKCVEYYQKEPDYVNFTDRFISTTLYLDKLKSSLISKFPRDESEVTLWKYIKEALGCSGEEKESLLSIPSVSKNSLIPNMNSSNLMMPTDISSLLFNSGKFPSASSLLGLPDPMAHSTLAANNMFLSTNLFKMQELLKPLSTSSPISSTKTKNDKSSSPLKIPTDIKAKDYSMDFLYNMKNKMDFSHDMGLNKLDFSLGNSKGKDYSLPDFSKTGQSDFSLNLSKYTSDEGEKSMKIPKVDFSGMDLSVSKAETESKAEPTDLSIGLNETETKETAEEKPLNLTGD